MSFSFRPAARENVGLIIGLIGPSGGGKTFTAMRIAKGLAGAGRFAVIDTEARRACHYADRFEFDHGDLKPPFSPSAYADAVQAADGAGYPVIIVDSCSHEHAGDGGILDMQEQELDRMAGQDWQKREAVKMAAWVRPKGEHKRMVQRLLQVRAHLILCFRAEEKIEMVREGGKLVVRPKVSSVGAGGWIPVCEKTMPYELTASFLLTPDTPGVPKPIKLQEQHRPFFPLDKPITEESGERLAEWAKGSDIGARSRSQDAGQGAGDAGMQAGRDAMRNDREIPGAAQRPDQAECAALLARIQEGFKRLNLGQTEQLSEWGRACGSAPFMEPSAGVDALTVLLERLRELHKGKR